MANPCYLTVPLAQDEAGQLAERALPRLLELIGANDLVALGPGLGRSPEINTLVARVIAEAQRPWFSMRTA